VRKNDKTVTGNVFRFGEKGGRTWETETETETECLSADRKSTGGGRQNRGEKLGAHRATLAQAGTTWRDGCCRVARRGNRDSRSTLSDDVGGVSAVSRGEVTYSTSQLNLALLFHDFDFARKAYKYMIEKGKLDAQVKNDRRSFEASNRKVESL
jgi:hypothetical protein